MAVRMVKSYTAGSRLLNRKMPSEVATVIRTAPVATFFSSTVTFGTAELLGSVTVPCKVAPVVWAKAQLHATATVSKTNRTRFEFIPDPPYESTHAACPATLRQIKRKQLLHNPHP